MTPVQMVSTPLFLPELPKAFEL